MSLRMLYGNIYIFKKEIVEKNPISKKIKKNNLTGRVFHRSVFAYVWLLMSFVKIFSHISHKKKASRLNVSASVLLDLQLE